jgi:phospholipase D1/2
MPFNERFWRDDEIRDETRTWDAKSCAVEKHPAGVEGFIVELPTHGLEAKIICLQ